MIGKLLWMVLSMERISQHLYLSFSFPINKSVGHHIDLESPVKTHSVKTPLCLQNIPITLYTYDHLEGVANRHTLPGISEHGLLTTMKYVTDVDDWGDRIARALTKVCEWINRWMNGRIIYKSINFLLLLFYLFILFYFPELYIMDLAEHGGIILENKGKYSTVY